MLFYMTHPQHGVHIALDEDEAKTCEKNGWIRRKDAADAASVFKKPASDPAPIIDPPRPILHVPKRGPGRPRKGA